MYESGAAGGHAKSLWRLELLHVKWYGAYVTWGYPFRLRHVTTGDSIFSRIFNQKICR